MSRGDSPPLVSALLITRDRPELLQRCVLSIVANRHRPLEVVVVDNGSPSAVRAIEAFLATIDGDVATRHVVTPPVSLARLRQLALERSSGELLLSIDDDCVAEPDAIENMVRRFEADPSIGVIGGKLTNVGFTGRERFKGRGRIGINGFYEPVEDPETAEVFGGANASFRRSALLEAGGYDPFFSGALEDIDAVLSIRELGYRVVYAADVRVTHHHTPARFRRLWRNLHAQRLYLFFKHEMPRSPAAWARFLAAEAGFYVRDVWLLFSTFRLPQVWSGGLGVALVRLAKLLVLRGIEWIKATGARLGIPLLALRAAGVRRRHRQRAGAR